MKIAAITKFKHGGLWEALKKLGWTQSRLADECKISKASIGQICNLTHRPSVNQAELIERILLAAGVDWDSKDEWPETFKGFKTKIKLEQIAELDNLQLEAVQEFYFQRQIDGDPDTLPYDAEALDNALGMVSSEEKLVLEKRFGLNGSSPLTLKQIGDSLFCTPENVRRIESSALRKLRSAKVLTLLQPA